MLRLIPLLALLLTGCSALEGFDPEINAVGRQTVADWKQRSDVVAAQFEYKHGLDAGGSLKLEVMLKAEDSDDSKINELVELVERNCWRTWKSCNASYTMYTTADPPYADVQGSGKPVREGRVTLTGEMESRYGPRPTRPAK
ncbi:hypothetical protein ACIA8G_24615 [Lentzea sp. NPDC051213]|uniref:hypothetical protein n=1 Tax=Lentzea sp. NPDC051213 TaxID=3364126 RepID=UPI0037BDA89C